MKIPYRMTDEIKDGFGWHDRLYQSLFDILINSNGLRLLLSGLGIEELMKKAIKDEQRRRRKKSPGVAVAVSSEKTYAVFDHVTRRTIPFYKVAEFVTVKQIMQGLPQLAIAGCNLSESTIRRTLTYLSPPYLDYFIKLKYRPGVVQTRIIGLNIPVILTLIAQIWDRAIEDRQMRKDYLTVDDMIDEPGTNCRIADKGKLLLEPCIKYCAKFAEAFDFMSSYTDPIYDIYEFLGELKEHFPTGTSDLDYEFTNECYKIDKKIKRRYKKRAERRANQKVEREYRK